MPLSRPYLLSLVSVITGLLLTLDSFPSTNTSVLVPAPVPGLGLILTRCHCCFVVSFIADVSAYCAAVFLLVVLCFRLGCVRVDCVPSELAATFLSLRSIHLTPNPKVGWSYLETELKAQDINPLVLRLIHQLMFQDMSFSLIVNGCPSAQQNRNCGLLQG